SNPFFIPAPDSTSNIVTTVGNSMFPAGNVSIAVDGVLVAGTTNPGSIAGANNVAIPSSGAPARLPSACTAVVVPFWDDLYQNFNASATVRWQEQDGVLYVMWKDIFHNTNVNTTGITFEVQVFNQPSFEGPWIQIVYPDTTFGGSQAAADHG